MANSIFVSLTHAPSDIAAVRALLEAGFRQFGLPAPRAWLHNDATSSTLLTAGFIMVEGSRDEDQCWISIHRCEEALTDGDGCTVLAGVQTRRNWIFAGVVAYALCRFAGRSVFNDSGALDGQERYTAASLEAVLARLLQLPARDGSTAN